MILEHYDEIFTIAYIEAEEVNRGEKRTESCRDIVSKETKMAHRIISVLQPALRTDYAILKVLLATAKLIFSLCLLIQRCNAVMFPLHDRI
jgi:hypothetical protein